MQLARGGRATPFAAIALLVASCAMPADYAVHGDNAVYVRKSVAHDEDRKRDIPYSLYRPAALAGRHPIVLFSHGNGGTRRDGSYLAEHLASHGYVVVQVQHIGSDAAIWSGARSADEVMARMKAAAADRRVHDQRYRDIPAMLDELARLDRTDSELAGHLDLEAIGLSGHSWGALTTLVLVGARDGRNAPSYRDTRIKAAIALSPSLPQAMDNEMEQACRDIAVPMLHITGTRDSSPVVPGLNYMKRLAAYRAISAPEQHALVLKDADHMLFPGIDSPLRKITTADAPILRAVKAVSLAFWNTYLRRDQQAREWLENTYPNSGDPVVFAMHSRAR
jgi:predicted dienelactone hydrolase